MCPSAKYLQENESWSSTFASRFTCFPSLCGTVPSWFQLHPQSSMLIMMLMKLSSFASIGNMVFVPNEYCTVLWATTIPDSSWMSPAWLHGLCLLSCFQSKYCIYFSFPRIALLGHLTIFDPPNMLYPSQYSPWCKSIIHIIHISYIYHTYIIHISYIYHTYIVFSIHILMYKYIIYMYMYNYI